MYLEKRHINESTVLDCYGKFTDHDHDVFMQTLETLNAEGCRYVVVNLTSVYQLSESIIGLLKFALEYFTSSEGQLVLVSPLSSVRRELDRAEITASIPTYMSVYDALHRRNAVVNEAALVSAPLVTPRPFEIPSHGEDTFVQSEPHTHLIENELIGVGEHAT